MDVLVEYLDSQDYRIIMVARNYDKMKKLANNMKNAPFIISADLVLEEQIESFVIFFIKPCIHNFHSDFAGVITFTTFYTVQNISGS